MAATTKSNRSRRKADEQLALWRAFSGTYLSLCTHGQCEYDPKVLRGLWEDFQRDMSAGFPSLYSLTSTQH